MARGGGAFPPVYRKPCSVLKISGRLADRARFTEQQHVKRDGGVRRCCGSVPAFRCRQPALQVLPGCHPPPLHVHVVQPAEQEAPELVPVFGLAEQRLDPDLPFAQGLLVRFSGLVGTHPIQTGFIDTAAEATPLLSSGTLGFEWAVITVLGMCLIAA